MVAGFHHHYHVKCVVCGVEVWPKVTCARKRGSKGCPIRAMARCAQHFAETKNERPPPAD